MKKILLASGNRHKADEYQALAKLYGELDIQIEIDAARQLTIIEDGATFMANAWIKARAWREATGLPILADDSGLAIDALNGEPGIYSARYLRPDATFPQRMDDLIRRTQPFPPEKRSAKFHCALAYIDTHIAIQAYGVCPGFIADKPVGEYGFGYDPLFYLPRSRCTMAQIPPDEKHKISHRAAAFKNFLRQLNSTSA